MSTVIANTNTRDVSSLEDDAKSIALSTLRLITTDEVEVHVKMYDVLTTANSMVAFIQISMIIGILQMFTSCADAYPGWLLAFFIVSFSSTIHSILSALLLRLANASSEVLGTLGRYVMNFNMFVAVALVSINMVASCILVTFAVSDCAANLVPHRNYDGSFGYMCFIPIGVACGSLLLVALSLARLEGPRDMLKVLKESKENRSVVFKPISAEDLGMIVSYAEIRSSVMFVEMKYKKQTLTAHFVMSEGSNWYMAVDVDGRTKITPSALLDEKPDKISGLVAFLSCSAEVRAQIFKEMGATVEHREMSEDLLITVYDEKQEE